MKRDPALLLGREHITKLLSVEDCAAAVENAFRLQGEGTAPAPGMLSMHTAGGGFHIKAGFLHLEQNYFAAKVNGNFPANHERLGLPTIQGVIVLCSGDDGRVLALMDSMEITALRTAAATAVAAKYLARRDSKVATVCGCGRQGSAQLQALLQMFPLQKIFAYDANTEAARRFAAEFATEGMAVEAVADLASATRQSDVIVTCTTSRSPFLLSQHIRAGTFIAAVGADHPEKQELHPELMASSKVVADIREQCATIGDLHHAIKAGAMAESEVYAELGEVVAGKKPGRTSDKEIIVFDSTGMALQDVAAAAVVYERASAIKTAPRFDFAA